MTVDSGDISRGTAVPINYDSAPTSKTTGMSDQASIIELSRAVADLKIKVQQLEQEARSASLGNSSIEDGKVEVYDRSGQVRQTVGRQNDGSFAVTYANGPKPPAPTPPICAAAELSIVVYWDGLLANNAVKPTDFARVDVHISDQADFSPNPNTLYASLFGESATTIPMGVVQLYVKLVSVSNSDVISDPSTTVPVKPAAARNIEAKTIGAEQLKSDIILTSTIYAGDPATGEYVKMTPSGLYVFDSTNTIRALFQGEDVMVSGEIRSSDFGERVVINEADVGDPSVRFYPDTGSNFAEIRSRTETLDSINADVANLFLRTPGTWQTRAANIENLVQADFPSPNIGYRRILQGFSYADGTPNPWSLMEHVQWGSQGVILLRNTNQNTGILWGNKSFYFTDSNGNGAPRADIFAKRFLSDSYMEVSQDVNGNPGLFFGNKNLSLVGGGDGIHVANYANSAYADIRASSFFAFNTRIGDRVVYNPGGNITTDPNGSMNSLHYYGGTFHGAFDSERYLKDHIEDITDGLSIIKRLVPARWTWKDPQRDLDKGDCAGVTHAGLYVDEVAEAAPEAVFQSKVRAGTVYNELEGQVESNYPIARKERTYDDRAILAYLVSAVQTLATQQDRLAGMISPVTT